MSQKILNAIITILVLLGLWAVIIDYKVHAENEWTQETQKKHAKLMRLGFSDTLSAYLINKCKEAKNPEHCVITGGYIGKNESNAGNVKNHNNVFGINGAKFETKEQAVDDWVRRYNKKWYRTVHPRDFYPVKGGKSKTNYCASEHSSNSSIGCPNGLKISTKAFLFLKT